MNNKDRFNHLVQQYGIGMLTLSEQEELFGMITSGEYDSALSKLILQDLAHHQPQINTDLPPHISQEIVRNVIHAERNVTAILPRSGSRIRMGWMMAAAAACIAGCIFFIHIFTPDTKFNTASFNALIPDNAITRVNNTVTVDTVLLPDGSTVSLKPRSSIHYRGDFATDKREVYLEGEAFFQITSNARSPFLVYYGNIVSRVLGTSFNINTNPVTGHVEVVVKTGKVQVYENEQLVKGKHENNAVIITPNQKAIYKENDRLFQTTLVETPQPVAEMDYESKDSAGLGKMSFLYDQQKLSHIFRQLEKTYMIEIVVENESINDCMFTGDISDNNLYNKLKIICLATNASFEINGTRILIKGSGCN